MNFVTLPNSFLEKYISSDSVNVNISNTGAKIIFCTRPTPVLSTFLPQKNAQRDLNLFTELHIVAAPVLAPEHRASIRVYPSIVRFSCEALLFLAAPRCTFYTRDEKLRTREFTRRLIIDPDLQFAS